MMVMKIVAVAVAVALLVVVSFFPFAENRVIQKALYQKMLVIYHFDPLDVGNHFLKIVNLPLFKLVIVIVSFDQTIKESLPPCFIFPLADDFPLLNMPILGRLSLCLCYL
jgi:hypothetical protein